MAELLYREDLAENIAGNVVVIVGGAQGIGAATVALFFTKGAHVFFGDWDAPKGEELVKRLREEAPTAAGSLTFHQVDVRDYGAQLHLFAAAYETHSHIDIAVSCAGVTEPEGWFGSVDLDLESVKVEPGPIYDTIAINLTSVISFCRIALAYMKESKVPQQQKSGAHTAAPKSIVLVSSIAGLVESPGLFAYGASKHGVVGLMRAMRSWSPAKYGVRINAVCPWATDTKMMDRVRAKWIEAGLPINTTEQVAKFLLQCAVESGVNGKAVLIVGGRAFDTEEGLQSTLPVWMGPDLARAFHCGQETLGLGDDWSGK